MSSQAGVCFLGTDIIIVLDSITAVISYSFAAANGQWQVCYDGS